MIASCGCRVKSYRAKQADGKWFCPGCYSEYVNRVEFYTSTHKLWDGNWYVWVQWKVDGKIRGFNVHNKNKEMAEALALKRIPRHLLEKFNSTNHPKN